MSFKQRAAYKCLVFLFMFLLLPVRALADDLRSAAEKNPLSCVHYLIAKSFENGDSLREQAVFLSLAYWKLGRHSEALQVFEFIDGTAEKTHLLMLFADALSKDNHRDEAATLLRKAFETAKGDYAWDEMNTFAKIPTQLVSLNNYQEALDIAHALEDAEDRANALAEMAHEYLRQGKTDKALELLAEALPVAKESKYEDLKAFVMAKIGAAYAIAGKRAEAKELLSQSLELSRVATANNISSDRIIHLIATAYFALGEEERIYDLFEELEEAHRFLAINYLKRGEKEKALKALSAIEAHYKKDCENVGLVGWYLRFENYEAAAQVIKTNTCAYASDKVTAALEIARASIGKRPHQEVADMLTFALQQALTLSNYEPDEITNLSTSDAMSKAYYLAEIADVMMDANCFDLAFTAVNAIEKPFYKAQKLSDLAGRQIKSLPKQKVLELLSPAWQLVSKTPRSPLDLHRYFVQINIASRYAEAGEKSKAAELFAQIIAQEKQISGEGSDTYLLKIMIELGTRFEQNRVPANANLKKTLRKIIKDWQDD